MKLSVKNFRNGQYKTSVDRKLSLISEMKESKNKYVYAIKAKGSIQNETHLKINSKIFAQLTLKRRLITPSKTSHLVFPLTPMDPIKYA